MEGAEARGQAPGSFLTEAQRQALDQALEAKAAGQQAKHSGWKGAGPAPWCTPSPARLHTPLSAGSQQAISPVTCGGGAAAVWCMVYE